METEREDDEDQNVDTSTPDLLADMFSDGEEQEDGLSRVKIEIEIASILAKSDSELFEEGLNVPERVKRSKKYIDRKRNYIENYMIDKMADLSSQEILMGFSQNPLAVQESQAMISRLGHLSKEEKSNRVVTKALNDTIAALNNTPGQEAKNQIKIIVAAATHHRWGAPSLPSISWRTRAAAKNMKLDLLSGTASVLTPPTKKKKQMFPPEAVELCVEHWKDNTVIEPALHSRKALSDERETVPTCYQTLTDKEQYCLFKDDCSTEMEDIMRKYSIEETIKIQARPDSADKTKRLSYYASLHGKFPSIDWYLSLKPKEVKPMHDHTTALCKECESTLLNYDTLVKAVKAQCKCLSSQCPNWICMCSDDKDYDEDDPSRCTCECHCDDCNKCKVTIIITNAYLTM